eukprot:3825251-Rhodomonas_salina.1
MELRTSRTATRITARCVWMEASWSAVTSASARIEPAAGLDARVRCDARCPGGALLTALHVVGAGASADVRVWVRQRIFRTSTNARGARYRLLSAYAPARLFSTLTLHFVCPGNPRRAAGEASEAERDKGMESPDYPPELEEIGKHIKEARGQIEAVKARFKSPPTLAKVAGGMPRRASEVKERSCEEKEEEEEEEEEDREGDDDDEEE